MNTNLFKRMLALVAMMAVVVGAQSQAYNQAQQCPGWNNPTSFTQGDANNYYSAAIGSASGRQGSNVMNGDFGLRPLTNGVYVWPTILTATQIATQGSQGCAPSSGGSRGIPDGWKQFRIMNASDQQSGHPVNRDPNTQDHLPFVPTQFNTTDQDINTNLIRSVRIGDDCTVSGQSANALYYHIKPNFQNGLLFIYYAVVVEKPSHGVNGNPAFMIRVTRKNSNNQYVQISDTLAYAIVSGTTDCPIESNINTNGWHEAFPSTSNPIQYKDWVKVALNLNNHLYENLRVEIMISDCSPQYHYGYAYVAGECRPLALNSTGCPAGRATNVTTLSAPRGMLRYEWAASDFGQSDPANDCEPGQTNAHFTFRTLTMPNGLPAVGPQDSIIVRGSQRDTVHYCDYPVQASDFHITRRNRANGAGQYPIIDSVGMDQTIRCKMTSALDPAKPFTSSLYTNVTNTKPTMGVDSLSTCDGRVFLRNQSFVPGNPSLVVDSVTRWAFYNNAACGGSPVATLIGDTASYVYSDADVKGVVVRTFTTDTACWSEAQYSIKPRITPNPGMTLSRRVLCDADETTITDTTSSTYYRTWKFLKESATSYNDPAAEYDYVSGYYTDNRSITRGFTHDIEPIELLVRNGMYYLNPTNIRDTIWCENTAYDTVAVFVHPNLEVTGDTIVCQGSPTDATVTAVGVSNCTYEWSRTYGAITGGIPAGSHLAVMPYADTSVYYVRVTTQEGCVAWDSVHAYLVRPVLTMQPTDGRICPGDEAVLTGSAADHYTWTASPSDPSLSGQDSADVIHVSPSQTTVYTMVGHGTNNCDASPLTKTVTVVPLAIPRITTTPTYVDADDPTIILRDISPNGVRSEWEFYNGDVLEGREVTHTFDEAVGRDSVYTHLTSYNVLDCPNDKVFGIPVMMFTAWFPNIFTPGSEDENAKFRLYTINDYEVFHIYIYNRGGQLVFESTDPQFEWDGTYNGENCVQGTYVYVCNYRKAGTTTLVTKNGSITLVR